MIRQLRKEGLLWRTLSANSLSTYGYPIDIESCPSGSGKVDNLDEVGALLFKGVGEDQLSGAITLRSVSVDGFYKSPVNVYLGFASFRSLGS